MLTSWDLFVATETFKQIKIQRTNKKKEIITV